MKYVIALTFCVLCSVTQAADSQPNVVIICTDDLGYGNGLTFIARTGEPTSDITAKGKIKPDAPQAQVFNLTPEGSQTEDIIGQNPKVTADPVPRQAAPAGSTMFLQLQWHSIAVGSFDDRFVDAIENILLVANPPDIERVG